MQNYYLNCFPFPAPLHGVIPGFTLTEGGSVFVNIDRLLPAQDRERILKHELAHIALNHLQFTKPLNQVSTFGADMFGDGWEDREREADAYAAAMTDAIFQHLLSYRIQKKAG